MTKEEFTEAVYRKLGHDGIGLMMEFADKQFQLENTDECIGFAFDKTGQFVINPWMDPSARSPLTTEQALETYGAENLMSFAENVRNILYGDKNGKVPEAYRSLVQDIGFIEMIPFDTEKAAFPETLKKGYFSLPDVSASYIMGQEGHRDKYMDERGSLFHYVAFQWKNGDISVKRAYQNEEELITTPNRLSDEFVKTIKSKMDEVNHAKKEKSDRGLD